MTEPEQTLARNYLARIRGLETPYFYGPLEIPQNSAIRVHKGLVFFRVEVIPQFMYLFGERCQASYITFLYHIGIEARFVRSVKLQNHGAEECAHFMSFDRNTVRCEYRLTD